MQEGTIGITAFAAGELGDVVHVDLPEKGKSFGKGESIVYSTPHTLNRSAYNSSLIQCGIESVKTAADVYAPVGGNVIDVNANISTDPALVNAGAESKGWLIKVKVSDEKALSKSFLYLVKGRC